MELVAENGCIVPIPKGCKKELGRGPELAIHDKTVSRQQILLELQEKSKEASSVDHDSYFGLSIKVLGANPVCIVRVGQSTGRRSEGQEMILLKKGEMDTLFLGDKISLSLSLPMFLTVREGEGRKNIGGFNTEERASSPAVVPKEEEMPTNAECSKQLAEDGLLGKWKNRKKEQKNGPYIVRDTERAEAWENRQILADEDVATNEEEAGIAQAVARRQKRAFERHQQQEQNLHDKRAGLVKELEDVPNVDSEASKLEDIFVDTENIDPVKEFGFLVEGSEFEQYKKRQNPDGGRWVWPPAAKAPESGSDEDDEDQQQKHTRNRKGKKRTDEDDEDWKGDDQEDKVAIASAKKLKAGAKVNLRSHEPSSSKKRETAMKKAVTGSSFKDRREEIEDEDEDEDDKDEADETLGGFIVNDNEGDDPLDGNADDEEDEASDDEDIDEEMDEAKEEDEEDAQHNKSKKKREEKPLCKYGKKCYRKNQDHLAQYRH